MANEGKDGVLMLTRDKLYLYDGSAVLELNLPSNVIHDLDVKDRDGLFNLVSTFIQNNKLIPAQLFFVLGGSVCFVSDITVTSTTDPAKATALVQEFIDTIPFSLVLSKIYKSPTAWRVIGVNQDLVDAVFAAFGNRGFGLSALIPAIVFPDLAMSRDLSIPNAQLILNKKNATIEASMVGEKTMQDQQLTTTQTAVPKNKLLPYLLIGFGVLFAILVAVLIMRK